MKLFAGIRNMVGAALLACGWALVIYVSGAYSGQTWIVDAFARYLIPGWLLMVPLGLLHALLALPGGEP